MEAVGELLSKPEFREVPLFPDLFAGQQSLNAGSGREQSLSKLNDLIFISSWIPGGSMMSFQPLAETSCLMSTLSLLAAKKAFVYCA